MYINIFIWMHIASKRAKLTRVFSSSGHMGLHKISGTTSALAHIYSIYIYTNDVGINAMSVISTVTQSHASRDMSDFQESNLGSISQQAINTADMPVNIGMSNSCAADRADTRINSAVSNAPVPDAPQQHAALNRAKRNLGESRLCRQQVASKRAKPTLASGIPRSFLPQSLAMRFQTAIKSDPKTSTALVPQSPN